MVERKAAAHLKIKMINLAAGGRRLSEIIVRADTKSEI